MNNKYWEEEIETMPREQLREPVSYTHLTLPTT